MRSIYYYLLRHTQLMGKETGLFAIAPLSNVLRMSDWKVREAIRDMDRKGCIKIESRSRKGHLIRILLPDSIDNLILEAPYERKVDIESIDFFANCKYLDSPHSREEQNS